jgi:DNA polymerase III delta subunit
MCPIEFFNKADIINEIETKGLFFSQKLMRLTEKDWFLTVEIARAMPFFKSLDINDKV